VTALARCPVLFPTKAAATEYQPFYSFRHGGGRENKRAFWYAERRPATGEGDRGTDVYLHLVDLDFDPRAPAVDAYSREALPEKTRAAAIPGGEEQRFLLDRGVVPWMELPLWLPEERAAYQQGDVSKAVAAALRFRPVVETVRDTLEWAYEAGADLVTPGEVLTQGWPPPASESFWRPGRTHAPS